MPASGGGEEAMDETGNVIIALDISISFGYDVDLDEKSLKIRKYTTLVIDNSLLLAFDSPITKYHV